jgi:hypothetical protein
MSIINAPLLYFLDTPPLLFPPSPPIPFLSYLRRKRKPGKMSEREGALLEYPYTI